MSSSVKRSASRARTIDSGRYWSSRSSPMSPSGITSMKVRSMPRPCAQSTRSASSSSLTPLSATALILTLRPAACAASMPASTLSRSPQRVMARNLSGIERVERDVDALDAAALRARRRISPSCEPLVVSVSSSSAPLLQMPRQRREQRHDVAPHQRLAAGQPQLAHALGDEGRAQPVEFLQRQQVGLRQERHVLGHAIDAAEIAAVGHRHPQIGDGPGERVDQRRRVSGGAVEIEQWVRQRSYRSLGR